MCTSPTTSELLGTPSSIAVSGASGDSVSVLLLHGLGLDGFHLRKKRPVGSDDGYDNFGKDCIRDLNNK